MGYNTIFKLNVDCLFVQKESQLTIDDVIENIKKNSSKEEIIKSLELIKSGEKEPKIDSDFIIDDLRCNNENARYAFDENGFGEEGCKWYSYDDDMRKFSQKYPKWLFILEGIGEEHEDMWVNYYLNGKCQKIKAKIIFDQFDIEKLA